MKNRIILEMIKYNGNDMPRINHALKVYSFASAIAGSELPGEKDTIEVIELAAILHDIGIHECETLRKTTSGKCQERMGPPIARELLSPHYPENIVDRVCMLIGKHHTYNPVVGTDHQIILEADLIVNFDEGWIKAAGMKKALEKIFRTSAGIAITKTIFKGRL
jgi:hypothetical protein